VLSAAVPDDVGVFSKGSIYSTATILHRHNTIFHSFFMKCHNGCITLPHLCDPAAWVASLIHRLHKQYGRSGVSKDSYPSVITYLSMIFTHSVEGLLISKDKGFPQLPCSQPRFFQIRREAAHFHHIASQQTRFISNRLRYLGYLMCLAKQLRIACLRLAGRYRELKICIGTFGYALL